MFSRCFSRWMNPVLNKTKDSRRAGRSAGRSRNHNFESLEARTLLSESASAQLSLVSVGGTEANPVYHYQIEVTDTGTTDIGTFWFAWVPGEDFLPTMPRKVSSPSGWSDVITGSNNSSDCSAIQWVSTSQPIAPGQSL